MNIRLLRAWLTGVAMTLDPSTGNPSVIVIDASWGVGEMVVSGEVTPDHYRIDKVTLQDPDITIGDKHAELVPDPSTGTLVHRDVEPERRGPGRRLRRRRPRRRPRARADPGRTGAGRSCAGGRAAPR